MFELFKNLTGGNTVPKRPLQTNRMFPSKGNWEADEPIRQEYYSFENGIWTPVEAEGWTIPLGRETPKNFRFSVLSWNIDFMRPLNDERMSAALNHLRELTPPAQGSHPAVIMLDEMTPRNLKLIKGAEWVREMYLHAHPHALPIKDVFRVHYQHTSMHRDALFVDIALPGELTFRLCATHLESLRVNPPKRPTQLATVATYLQQAHAGVVAGDFNAIEDFDKTLHVENGLVDAYLHMGGVEGAEEGMTWGQMAGKEMREMFGCGRLDKMMFCGGEAGGFETFGLDVVVEDEIDANRLRIAANLEKGWVTDHLGVREKAAIATGATSQRTWPLPEITANAPLPEDDGMGDLRRRIQAIQVTDLPQDAKAQLMHRLLTENYTKLHQPLKPVQISARPVSPASTSTLATHDAQEHIFPLQVLMKWNPLGDMTTPLKLPLTDEDVKPTYAPRKQAGAGEWWETREEELEEDAVRRLGCEHYTRNVKLQCASCERWYTCRRCHDAVEDHTLPRQQTKHMLCMLCGCAQKASDTCTKCGVSAAYYYCGICKLWNNDSNKPIYHCADCGLCRVGQGLGKDFFHCKKCTTCVEMSANHKCFEQSVDCDCPICSEYLFNSPKSVIFMQCGHSIHRDCFDAHMKTSYKCPLCNKSCLNMEIQFRNIDVAILTQPMPPEYADARAIISCNDCSAKSQTAYHWLGLKCAAAAAQAVSRTRKKIKDNKNPACNFNNSYNNNNSPHRAP
ncbi:hypothetical protein N0V88_000255 [Collariella sp. IMI 366227]|nr:hypothetical protein N0V88_000255 [Collariella sp. IMI 366227]